MSGPSLDAPGSLEELAALLGTATDSTRVVAGSTDLTLQLRASRKRPDRLIELGRVPELCGITLSGQRMRIGAMVTFAEIASSACVQQRASCLATAARRVGSIQVRGVATLGGNVANAAACADGVAPLLVLDADVGVLGAGGGIERRPLAALFASHGGSALRPGEVIVDFSFRALDAQETSGFAKLGVRTSIAVSRLNAAAVLALSPDGATCLGARVAYGSLAASARLNTDVAKVLVGRRLDGKALAEFMQASSAYVDQAIPDRPSRAYKRGAIRGVVVDLWSALGLEADAARR